MVAIQTPIAANFLQSANSGSLEISRRWEREEVTHEAIASN